MSTTSEIFPYYPPRPMNGGNLDIVGFDFGKDPSEWCFQPKVNGERVIISLHKNMVCNRHGSLYTKVERISKPLTKLKQLFRKHAPQIEWIDCEAMTCKGNLKETLVVLDVFVDLPLEARHELLNFIPSMPSPKAVKDGGLYLIPQYDWSRIRPIWNRLQNYPIYEGVVAKQKGSGYLPNYDSPLREISCWRKHRFN